MAFGKKDYKAGIDECNEANNSHSVATLPCAAAFFRGDCNTDGLFNIADPIFILASLFSGGPAGACADACDVNDDGALDIGDAVYALSNLFSGGALPPAPFVTCGSDPTEDSLDCLASDACP